MAGRRQVLSYSDSYAAPSGEVDLEAPLPSLNASAGPSGSWATSELSSYDSQYQDEGYWAPSAGSTSYLPPHDGAAGPSIQPPYQPGYQNGGYFPQHAVPFYHGPPPGAFFQQGYPPQPHIPAQHQPVSDFSTPPPTAPRAVREAAARSRGKNSAPKPNTVPPSPWGYQQSHHGPFEFPPPAPSAATRMPWPHSSYRAWTAVIIEDCDESSDEEEDEQEVTTESDPTSSSDGEYATAARRAKATRRLLGRTIRQQTMKDVSQLWAKLQKAQSAAQAKPIHIPTSSISERVSPTPAPTPPPAAPAASHAESNNAIAVEKELSDYEKKQKEIQAMMDKIKKLEEARLKGKPKAAGPTQTPPPVNAASGDSSSLVTAAVSQTLTGQPSPADLSRTTLRQEGQSTPSIAPSTQDPPATVPPPVPGAHTPLASPAAKPAKTAATPASPVPKMALNPALAEQKRLLLERMQQARKAIQSQKRKADGTPEGGAASPAAEGVLTAHAVRAVGENGSAVSSRAGSEESQVKRQRRDDLNGDVGNSTDPADAKSPDEPS